MSVSRRINQNNLKKIFANLKFWLETALKKIGTDSTLQKIGKKVLVSAKHFSLVTRKKLFMDYSRHLFIYFHVLRTFLRS